SEGLHALLEKCADAFESGVASAADTLEGDRLARREDGAGLLHAAQGVIVIDAVATADGIDGDVDAEVQRQQVEGGAQDADVRLDTGEHNLGPRLAVQR